MNGRAKPERACFVSLGASLIISAAAFAAPGGYLVEALSDECDTLNPIWSAGLRGMPEALTIIDGTLSIRSIDNGDDDYPSAEDMTSTYANQLGRGLDAGEGPSVIARIWLPPFNEWPTGSNAFGLREWFGVRVTAYDAGLPNGTGLYFPGIYLATDDAGPCLIARSGDGYGEDVTIGRVQVAGWWTFGLAWDAEGRTEYYAAPGRVDLTSAHLLYKPEPASDPAANRSIDQLIGNFIALRMTYPSTGQLSPDWRMDDFRVYVKQAPQLPQADVRLENGVVYLRIAPGSAGFRFLLQRSVDLSTWSTIADYINDGTEREFSEPAAPRMFYRSSRP